MFCDCSGLISITIPFIGENESSNKKFGYLFSGNTEYYSSYSGKGPSSLKEVIISDKCKIIPSDAFSNWNSLTSVIIGDGVTSIGIAAFSGCSSLTSMTVPDSVTSIGRTAFRNCSSLISITIPFVGDSEVSDKCFGYIFEANSAYSTPGNTNVPSSLKEVIVSNKCKFIPNAAFAECKNLTDVTIGSGVTGIGERAFCQCINLTSVTIGGSIESIGEYAFENCTSLTNITIPYGVTSIGDYAFSGCSNLTSIIIPDGVTSIGDWAFYGCHGVTSVTIPDTVTSIGFCALDFSAYLQYNTFGNALYLGNADNPYVVLVHATGYNINNINIHDQTKVICYYAFSSCTGLTSVTIPDGVASIGERAFQNCSSLTSIIIPDGVTSIGGGAFYGCSSLSSITYNGTKAQWDSVSKGNSWDNNTGFYTIHCTDGDIVKSDTASNVIIYYMDHERRRK